MTVTLDRRRATAAVHGRLPQAEGRRRAPATAAGPACAERRWRVRHDAPSGYGLPGPSGRANARRDGGRARSTATPGMVFDTQRHRPASDPEEIGAGRPKEALHAHPTSALSRRGVRKLAA